MAAQNSQPSSAASAPLPGAEDTYWGPEYSPNASTVTLGQESVSSGFSPPPSPDDWTRQRDLIRALQREILRETFARLSGNFHLTLLGLNFNIHLPWVENFDNERLSSQPPFLSHTCNIVRLY